MATATRPRSKASPPAQISARMADWLQERLPGRVRRAVGRARGQDILLYAAALGFYAIVSIVPLTIVAMWIVTLILGDQRTQQLAEEIRRVTPQSLGADQALERVADLGATLGVASILTALWPATAYGSGLERAFDRLGPKGDTRLEGLRGRGMFLLVVLPTFILGSLIGSFVGSVALGTSGVARVVGYGIALGTGFLTAAVSVLLIYRIFPPRRLAWRQIIHASVVTATGISVLSLLFILFMAVGANFEQHYATSGVTGLVLLALWLFLANAMLLVGYRVALKT